MLDTTSLTRIAGCLPDLQTAAQQLHDAAVDQLGYGFTVPDYGGLRTLADQQQLVKWRDEAVAAGQPYYQVAPYGQSRHEKGGAFDALPDGAKQGDTSDPRLAELGALGESLGLTWGGRWEGKKNDPWHFELAVEWSDLGDAWDAFTRGDLQSAGQLASEALSATGDAISQDVTDATDTVDQTVTDNPVASGGLALAAVAAALALIFWR
jgi:hypothetical protein